MARKRISFFDYLERSGLLKYVLATLLTVVSFTLTAGAYMYEEIRNRPPSLPPGFSLSPRTVPTPGYILRARVVTTRRFAVAQTPPFSLPQ